MDVARDIPNEVSFVVEIKVAIPSGILCNIIANIDIIPTLYKVSSVFVGKYLSIKLDIIIPNTMNINDNNITQYPRRNSNLYIYY